MPPSTDSSSPAEKIPVFLLKTRSAAGDAYEDLFSAPRDGFEFAPTFVPVLEHRFLDDGLAEIRGHFRGKRIANSPGSSYGGLIFTSQRAVEAFSKLVQDEPESERESWAHLSDVPVYSVGPATTRALKAIPLVSPLAVFGEHTGNGENLASFILEHYAEWYQDRSAKPPLLFVVGEQRRDIIPKMLMDENLPSERKIKVDEIVVYGTGVMESFEDDFAKELKEVGGFASKWVVVFSPTGCESMLRALNVLDETTRRAKPKADDRKIFVATIGPTTKDYLKGTFDFEADVCASKPSPGGVWDGISNFILRPESNPA